MAYLAEEGSLLQLKHIIIRHGLLAYDASFFCLVETGRASAVVGVFLLSSKGDIDEVHKPPTKEVS